MERGPAQLHYLGPTARFPQILPFESRCFFPPMGKRPGCLTDTLARRLLFSGQECGAHREEEKLVCRDGWSKGRLFPLLHLVSLLGLPPSLLHNSHSLGLSPFIPARANISITYCLIANFPNFSGLGQQTVLLQSFGLGIGVA